MSTKLRAVVGVPHPATKVHSRAARALSAVPHQTPVSRVSGINVTNFYEAGYEWRCLAVGWSGSPVDFMAPRH